MGNVSSDHSSSSGAASGEEITEAASTRSQFSMRSLLSVSAFFAALAGLGSQIPRNLESTHREAHSATPTSDLLITGPDTDKPGIFLTIKRSEEGETPSARLIEEYVADACSPEARYLTRLRLNRLSNSDGDFTALESIERIGDLSIIVGNVG